MKKGRKIVLAVTAITLLAAGQVFAQDTMKKYGSDSISCVTHASLYLEFYKQKNYADALPHWRWIFINCPIASQNTYIFGAKIIGSKINEAQDTKTRNAYIDTLMMVYDNRIKYFGNEPKSRPGLVKGRQGLELNNYKPSDTMRVYDYLRKSIELEGLNVDPIVVSTYYTIVDNLVSSKHFEMDSITETYDELSEIVDQKLIQLKDDTIHLSIWAGVKALLEIRFEPYATCDQIVKIYTKKFNQSPNDTTLLKKITRLLDKKDCTKTELFFLSTESLHKNKPTGRSAYLMGKMYWFKTDASKEDISKAENYFIEAIPGLDEPLKAKTYYYLAVINMDKKSFSEARSYAQKSLQINPNDGKCYILIGDMYAASAAGCGSDEIASRAGYWAAVDKFIKARNVDAKVSEDANKKIATYTAYFPTRERLFFNDVKEGNSYMVGCWIGESTTVRASR